MLIVGISNNDVAGACLVEDGRILAAASEERFTRVKDHKTWPQRSIDFVLQHGAVRLDQVDCVAYGWCAGFDADKHLLLYVDRLIEEGARRPSAMRHLRKRIADEISNDKGRRAEFDAFVADHHLEAKVSLIDHHECHSLGAFLCSPFDEALVITCDGRGDFQSLTVTHHAQRGEHVLLRETSIDSLGYFYGRITRLLGFRPNRNEGKVTGLAALGDPDRLRPLMREMIRLDSGRVRANCGPYYQPSYDTISDELRALVAVERPGDVAAAAQAHLEDILTGLVRQYLDEVGTRNVCLAGGVFGNVKLNQRIREMPGVANFYVLPPMGDGGLPLQAAVAAAYRKTGHRTRVPSMHLGPDAGAELDDVPASTGRFPGLRYSRTSDVHGLLLDALEHDQVVGLYRGRMEFGPRALGSRSVLYRTDDTTINDWLNRRFDRTEFMPFAPMTAEELAGRCYTGWLPEHVSARFMTVTYDCTTEFRTLCPAVVHVDGTARPQIVRRGDDPFLHSLLLAWYQRTGQPALVNTSFNKHEEPIVGSLRDAVDALYGDVIDVLFVQDSVVVWDERRNRLLGDLAAAVSSRTDD